MNDFHVLDVIRILLLWNVSDFWLEEGERNSFRVSLIEILRNSFNPDRSRLANRKFCRIISFDFCSWLESEIAKSKRVPRMIVSVCNDYLIRRRSVKLFDKGSFLSVAIWRELRHRPTQPQSAMTDWHYEIKRSSKLTAIDVEGLMDGWFRDYAKLLFLLLDRSLRSTLVKEMPLNEKETFESLGPKYRTRLKYHREMKSDCNETEREFP